MVNPRLLAPLEVEFVDFLTEKRREPRPQVKARYLAARNGFKTWTRAFKDYHLGILKMNGTVWNFNENDHLAAHYRQLEGYHALRFVSYCHNKEYMQYVNSFPGKILSALATYPKDILDYGCGMALMSTGLARVIKASGENPTVWLYDFPGVSRDFAVWRLQKSGIKVNVIDVDKDSDGIFTIMKQVDVCFVWSVFEHLLNPEGAAREVCQVVKPGGVLVSYLGDWRPEPLHVNFKQKEIKKIILNQFTDMGGWVYKKL